ncbi:hypothetical protein QJS10_CPB21g01177 [Acorus calamus]|uniref:Uncharacterized protein n=1 Tax=Acorus calamus TaxID=4465 RepID=A0AAV9C4K9_ACOCL|nr:hypothetical protein QJS10_CPB21g01177 [Acorus calamus]
MEMKEHTKESKKPAKKGRLCVFVLVKSSSSSKSFRWRNSQWMGFWDSGAWRWSIPLA